MTDRDISRRRLLAGIGTAGVAAGGIALLSDTAVALPNTMQISGQGDSPDLRIDWRETYNGSVLEGEDFPDTPVDAPGGPAVSIENVVPGDSGTLTLRVQLDEPAGGNGSGASTARVSFGLDVTATDENGLTEPELKAGDTAEGDLQHYTDVAVWYDVGAGGSGVGGCNGRREPAEPLLDPAAEGPLTSVAAALSDGVVVDPRPYARGRDPSCFSPGTAVCVTLAWSVDPDVGNVVQGDSVAFELRFHAEPCVDEQRGPPG